MPAALLSLGGRWTKEQSCRSVDGASSRSKTSKKQEAPGREDDEL
ncbi:unnamed protein product [Amoebophrya sp. A120]|nr:unnamed protein product [Amoebophrya sp. A120]|eukprot:GSA120T00008834001.1